MTEAGLKCDAGCTQKKKINKIVKTKNWTKNMKEIVKTLETEKKIRQAHA